MVTGKKKIWVKKFSSFRRAGACDDKYYAAMTPAERLEAMQLIRLMYRKLRRGRYNAIGTRLRRVIKVIQ